MLLLRCFPRLPQYLSNLPQGLETNPILEFLITQLWKRVLNTYGWTYEVSMSLLLSMVLLLKNVNPVLSKTVYTACSMFQGMEESIPRPIDVEWLLLKPGKVVPAAIKLRSRFLSRHEYLGGVWTTLEHGTTVSPTISSHLYEAAHR